jgi:hypothetical protein
MGMGITAEVGALTGKLHVETSEPARANERPFTKTLSLPEMMVPELSG